MRQHAGWILIFLSLLGCGGGGGGGGGAGEVPTLLRFDFQGPGDRLMDGFAAVTPGDLYSAERGHGFLVPPRSSVNGARFNWSVFGRTVTTDEAIPASVLSDATRDCVVGSTEMRFAADVPPGDYDVTLWLGDVTTPRHQVRAVVNGVVVDVERMDVNWVRGSFDQTLFGSAVPRTVRVAAPDGRIEVTVGPHPDGARPVTWTYEQDEDPTQGPYTTTATLVPAFTAAALQALEIHTAQEPALVFAAGVLSIPGAGADPALVAAVVAFNRGDVPAARAAFEALSGDALREAKAAGLLAVAGHPALIDDEPELLAAAEAALLARLATAPGDFSAADLLREVRLCADAERYRRLYGFASSGAPATENVARSCALMENLPPDHPYQVKGQILWLRNRGGLDPRRVTVSWERSQWLARSLDGAWGAANPYVHVYATDEWTADGRPWSVTDWAAAAGDGPEWARSLVANLNAWLDLFEWWAVNRQTPEGDIGGGWTDDVEIVPAFGLMAYVLDGASDVSEHSVVRFADGIWDSDVMDRDAGYQAQYADVEHTAEPTGNILHLYPLVRFGDPEGLERLMRTARTFDRVFLTDGSASPLGHRHFRGNHLSSTQIATNPNHAADIPLCGRVTAPLSFLVWLTDNPGAEAPLLAWATAWAEDAARTENGKPAGIFPNAIWTPTDGIGYPGTGDWWSNSTTYGQFSGFPGYQFYLYDLLGFFHLRTGDLKFRAPFDAMRDAVLAWDRARQPTPGAAPPSGGEQVWCGGKLVSVAAGATSNLAAATGSADFDAYLEKFGTSYGKFRLDPTDAAPIETLSETADLLFDRWPYRTTEGLMTDRILVPGWADVISYYIGADVFSVFFGMPTHAVTWRNTTRLFAAAVTAATKTDLSATCYLFADAPREVTLRLWQLESGADYVLEAGPAAGLGRPAATIDQTVPFRYEHRGEGVSFTLPGRAVTAIRIRQTAPSAGAAAPRPDLAVAPRDVTFEAGRIRVRVHNVGAADATNIAVTIRDGVGAGGAVLGTATIPSLPAPLDLVPRSVEVVIAATPAGPVTVQVDPAESIAETTEENNAATAWPGADPDLPPPMLVHLPAAADRGALIEVEGKHFVAGLTVLAGEAPTTHFTVESVTSTALAIRVSPSAPAGVHILGVENPDGKRSNLLPITIR